MRLHVVLPLVLVPATLLGALTWRAGMTALLGEIATGVLLGSQFLDLLPLDDGVVVFRELAHVGLCALLFSLGMKSRPEAVVTAWKPGLRVGLTGMALSVVLGAATAMGFGWNLPSAVFVGAALTATSISVPATVLQESRREDPLVSSIVLAAASVTDLSGLLLLSFLTAYFGTASTGDIGVLPAVARSVAFLTAGFLVGPLVVRRLVGLTRRIGSPTLLLVFAFSYLLLVAQAARAAGLAMVIGAYAAGLAFSRLEDRDRLEQEVRPLILLFRPLFFVLAGASISFSSLNVVNAEGRVAIAFTATLIVVAVVGKVAASWKPVAGSGSDRAIPWAMVARGGMGFVFAEAGVRSGFVPPPLYAAVAFTLTATTVFGAAGLRAALSRLPADRAR